MYRRYQADPADILPWMSDKGDHSLLYDTDGQPLVLADRVLPLKVFTNPNARRVTSPGRLEKQVAGWHAIAKPAIRLDRILNLNIEYKSFLTDPILVLLIRKVVNMGHGYFWEKNNSNRHN
ncbi:hypothetical protein PAXINDRAFT_99954 [Paxillus involutus ATCC 200175]|uniref:Uncharacterized protein n=1 Tax=Paxillus involutus ATCC 200175 TaxID=664439 RepID=A0A0C9SY06_PAXIN|nr:hypothetical protein PAXINDRAFT_99954 [Paxillus involutus ATCC 200175]